MVWNGITDLVSRDDSCVEVEPKHQIDGAVEIDRTRRLLVVRFFILGLLTAKQNPRQLVG